jgi:hypothetical protein
MEVMHGLCQGTVDKISVAKKKYLNSNYEEFSFEHLASLSMPAYNSANPVRLFLTLTTSPHFQPSILGKPKSVVAKVEKREVLVDKMEKRTALSLCPYTTWSGAALKRGQISGGLFPRSIATAGRRQSIMLYCIFQNS